MMGTMKPSEQLAVRVRRLLESVLPHGLRADVMPRQAAGPAFDVIVKAGATKHRFIVGWAGEGWPSDVERLAHLVPDVEVVTAAHLSDGAWGWLEGKGLGWADEAGRADISMKSGLVIFRQPSAARKRGEPSMRWTRSTLGVAEAALSGITPTVAGIEHATGLSRHATANALSRLEDLGFFERPRALRGPRSARRIINVGAFLDAYAKAVAEQRQKQPRVLLHRLWNGDPPRDAGPENRSGPGKGQCLLGRDRRCGIGSACALYHRRDDPRALHRRGDNVGQNALGIPARGPGCREGPPHRDPRGSDPHDGQGPRHR